jgi:hypothetical protein
VFFQGPRPSTCTSSAHPALPEVPDAANTVIQVDIPCDVQDEDDFGMPYALLSEARDPSCIVPGAIVITADEEDPSLPGSTR